jgi:molybdopterin molybdotransferase
VNSYALAAILQENGCAATLAPVAGDSRESVRESLEAQAAADLVVFSAGSSVGARDVLIDVLEEYGEVVVHGIALKPGKPTLFARLTRGSLRDRLVIGMPGYPTSCLSNAYMLLVPMVRRMASLPPRVQRTVEVPLARRIVSTTGRHQFFTVVLRGGLAHPAFKESGAITSMSQADGWIEIPANVDLVEKGENVRVMLFE